jgi:hypothetical protein
MELIRAIIRVFKRALGPTIKPRVRNRWAMDKDTISKINARISMRDMG